MKGLIVDVYRSKYDGTNNGISSKFDSFVLSGTAPVFESREDLPALQLVFEHGTYKAYPVTKSEDGHTHWMFGGNFVYTSDSRFPSKQPIKVFDRCETWEQYERLSK